MWLLVGVAVAVTGLAAAPLAASAAPSPGSPVVSNIHEVSLNARGVGLSIGNYYDTTLSRDGSLAVYRDGPVGPHLLAARTSGSVGSPAPTPVVVTSTSDGIPGGSEPTSWSVTDDGSQVFFLMGQSGILARNGMTTRTLIFVKHLDTGRLTYVRTPVVNLPPELGGTQRLTVVVPVQVSGDGSRVALSLYGKRSVSGYVYDVPTARWIDLCPGVTECYLKALSPDGRWAIVDDVPDPGRPALLVNIDTGESRVVPDSPPPHPGSPPFDCLFTGDSQQAICTVQGGVPFGPAFVSTQFEVTSLAVVRRVGFTSYGGVRAVDAHGQRWMIDITRAGLGPNLYRPRDAWVLQADTGGLYRLNVVTTPDAPGGVRTRGNGHSSPQGISNDGHTVLFTSSSTDLDPADRGPGWSLFAATLT